MTARVLHVHMATQTARFITLDSPDPHVPFISSLLSVFIDQTHPVLIFGVGPLAGRRGAGLSEAVIAGSSPHSGGVSEARVQGRLASALRAARLDAIVVTDCAQVPRVLTVTDDGLVTFQPAVESTSTWHITDTCRTNQPNAVVAAVGYRGPNASIVIDKGIATSIGALGVTMADLGLQALVTPWHEPTSNSMIDAITARYARDIPTNPLAVGEHDAPGFGMWLTSDLAGYVAGGDFERALLPEVQDFRAADALDFLIDIGANACPGCPQQCLKSFGSTGVEEGRLHQQIIAAFVAGFGDTDLTRAFEFNAVCHELGLEHLAIAACLRHVGWDRTRPVREQILAVQDLPLPPTAKTVKGMPLSPWDPRGSHGLAVGFALSPTGPHYDILEHDIDFDPNWAWQRHVDYGQEFGIPPGGLPVCTLTAERFPSLVQLLTMWSALTATGVCIYAGPPTRELRLGDVLAMVTSVTGISLTREEFLAMGRLRLAMLRAANIRLGLTPEDDDLPALFFTESTDNAGVGFPDAVIDRDEFEQARRYVMDALGWRADGSLDDDLSQTITNITAAIKTVFSDSE